VVAETQSARSGFPAGAIPTVEFLLHDFGRVVKKVGVKNHDSAGHKFCVSGRSGGWWRHLGRGAETQNARSASGGAIPTLDFLLHEIGAIVKKMPVKSHD
jgi:hypothetical protein